MSDDTETSIRTPVGELAVRTIGSGPPALLWHSLFVDATSWDRVAAGLAQERMLILVEGPSHGRSEPWHHRFSLQDCASAAGRVLDGLEVAAPVDWVGNAWGGHVGIVFAASQPSRVRSLTTVGTPVQALSPKERRGIVPLVALYRALGPVRPLVKGVEKALLGAGYDPNDAAFVSGPLRAANRRGMHMAMHSVMLDRPDLLELLPRIAAPTQFVAVKDDPLASVEQAVVAAKLLPQGRVTVVAGRGHIGPLLESPSELASTIDQFWKEADQPVVSG